MSRIIDVCQRGIGLLVLVAVLVQCVSPAVADDYFITIGGGYSPSGNQASLERNVIFQQQVLAEKRPDKPSHDIYFANGDDEHRDLQYRDTTFRDKCPTARRLMAELLGDADEMDLIYRNHRIPNVTGAADPKLVERRLKALARKLKSGDRVILYATAHGGAAEGGDSYRYRLRLRDNDEWNDDEPEYNKYDTSLYFWDSESIKASEFAGWLDQLPSDVTVVLVMVQCYAGGFAHTIFHQASADLGMSNHSRCGFFAQVHDRGAAGCTPDIDNADLQEYSTFFWAALRGRTRGGETITTADYDGNGTISFAEAHAYAVLESDTIDVPVRTSDEFLRKYSSLGKKSGDDESAKPKGLGRLFSAITSDSGKDDGPKFVELSGSLSKLAERGRPEERAILQGLAKEFEFNDRATIEEVQTKLKKIEAEGQAAAVKTAAAQAEYRSTRERVQKELRLIWPELVNSYSPMAMELASERSDEFTKRVEGMAAYQAMCKARERQEELGETYHDLLRQTAKLQRLVRTAENVVLAANLPQIVTPDVVAQYEKLRAAEEGGLEAATNKTDEPRPSTEAPKSKSGANESEESKKPQIETEAKADDQKKKGEKKDGEKQAGDKPSGEDNVESASTK